MTVTPRAKKPKYKFGQVVCVKPKYMHEGRYGRIITIEHGKDHITYGLLPDLIAVEFALRPLTARERGDRP